MRTHELGVLAFESLILVQILLQARNHSHLEQLAVTAMCWEKGSDRFWEPFRADLTDYPPFLWPLSSIAGTRWIVELLNVSSKLAETCGGLNKMGQERSILPNPGQTPARTILGGKIFHICYQIFPYLLSDLAAAIKSLEFIFPPGFDGAILEAVGKKAEEPDINL